MQQSPLGTDPSAHPTARGLDAKARRLSSQADRGDGLGSIARIPQTDEIAALKRELEQKGVQYCLPAYVDIHGIPKSKSVPISHFERAMRGSELFTGAALDGLGQDTHDDELALHPDPRAVTQLPWRPNVAWMPGNLRLHGEPWPMCSRTVLQRQTRPRREPRTAIQSRHRMRVLPRPRGRKRVIAGQSEDGHAQGRLRRPRPAREHGLARRGHRLHEQARLERPLLRSRGCQQPVRDRFRICGLPSRRPIVTSCSG